MFLYLIFYNKQKGFVYEVVLSIRQQHMHDNTCFSRMSLVTLIKVGLGLTLNWAC